MTPRTVPWFVLVVLVAFLGLLAVDRWGRRTVRFTWRTVVRVWDGPIGLGALVVGTGAAMVGMAFAPDSPPVMAVAAACAFLGIMSLIRLAATGLTDRRPPRST